VQNKIGSEIEFFRRSEVGRTQIFDSLVLDEVATNSWEPIKPGRPRETNSERSMKAKIELCVTRQVFDFKN
jgi:hypothetical protein